MANPTPVAIQYDPDDDTFRLKFHVDGHEGTLTMSRSQATELVEVLSEALIAYPEDLQRPAG